MYTIVLQNASDLAPRFLGREATQDQGFWVAALLVEFGHGEDSKMSIASSSANGYRDRDDMNKRLLENVQDGNAS